ncbi:hypothetical protein GCM10017708_00650 [Arthrobacter citreus]
MVPPSAMAVLIGPAVLSVRCVPAHTTTTTAAAAMGTAAARATVFRNGCAAAGTPFVFPVEAGNFLFEPSNATASRTAAATARATPAVVAAPPSLLTAMAAADQAAAVTGTSRSSSRGRTEIPGGASETRARKWSLTIRG